MIDKIAEQYRVSMRPDYQEIINKIHQNANVYFHDGDLVRFRPLASIQRPFSDVIKFELEFNHSKTNVVIKVFKLKNNSPHHTKKTMERVQKEFEVTKFFYEKFKNYPGYATINPIACFAGSLATVTEDSPGQNFRDLIIKKGRFYPNKATLKELSEHSYECGRWLRIFQGITRKQIDGRFQVDGLISDIDQRLKRLLSQQGSWFPSRLRTQILYHLEKQAALVNDSDLDLCGVHADFSPGNILINGKEIVVVDFAMYHMGSIYQDVTYFARYLENFLHKPIFRPKTISMLQGAFFEGYDQDVNPKSGICNLFKIRHVICHLIGVLDSASHPLHERLFNRRIARRYVRWLQEVTVNGRSR